MVSRVESYETNTGWPKKRPITLESISAHVFDILHESFRDDYPYVEEHTCQFLLKSDKIFLGHPVVYVHRNKKG